MLGEIRAMQVYTIKKIPQILFQKKLCCVKFYCILMYKTVLCKYGLTASKVRVMGIRAMENRVRRGMTVLITIKLVHGFLFISFTIFFTFY